MLIVMRYSLTRKWECWALLSVPILVSAIFLHIMGKDGPIFACVTMIMGPNIWEVKVTNNTKWSVKKHLLLANCAALSVGAVMTIVFFGTHYWMISTTNFFIIFIRVRKIFRAYFETPQC